MGTPGLFIFRELGSTGYYFEGFGQQAHYFGDLGSHAKKVKIKSYLKGKAFISFDLFLKKIFGFWVGGGGGASTQKMSSAHLMSSARIASLFLSM